MANTLEEKLNEIQAEINTITGRTDIRSVEEETADRERLKKLCWNIMVESRGARVMGREIDEAVFSQARMRLTALEHGAAIKDIPLMDELHRFATEHPDTTFKNAFEAFLNTNDPTAEARSNALELMSDGCGDVKGSESERIHALLETAMSRRVEPHELPGEHDRIETENYKADIRQTNIAKWGILRDWVRNNETIPGDVRQRMDEVLTASIDSGQMPADREGKNLIDRALNGSYSADRQKYTGYHEWARANNGRELPESTYVRRPMDRGRRYLIGRAADSSIYKGALGDIFIGNNDGVIPREIMNTSNVEEIADFITVYADELKRINPLYTDYLQRQTEAVIKLEGMAQSISKGNIPEQTGVKKLKHGSLLQIKQTEHQTSGNGCWSVAYSNMLQSQGVKLTQQEIRAYRQMKDAAEAGKLSNTEAEILFNDKVSNPFEKRDILHNLMPDKAMQEVVFSYTEEGDSRIQLKRTEDFLKKHIKEAIDIHHSPVALLVEGHYRTIVGYDGDRLLYKDSLPHHDLLGRTLPPDTTYQDLTFRALAEQAVDISAPVVLDSIIAVDKLPDVKADAMEEKSNPGSYAFMDIDTGVPGISMKVSHSKQVHSRLMKDAPVQAEEQAEAVNAQPQPQPEQPVNAQPEPQPEQPVNAQPQPESKAAAGANLRLEDAINDVEAVYGSNNGLSDAFTRVNTMASELRRITAPYYEEGRVLNDKDIDTIFSNYDNLLRACDDYLRNTKDVPDTGYDVGRAYCIRALRGIVVEDMRALNESMGVTAEQRTLLDVVQRGRTIQASVDRPDEIKTVGGDMSSRIPVRLRCEDGSIEEGFFTAGSTLEDFKARMVRLKAETRERYGEESVEYSIAKAVCIEDMDDMKDTRKPRYAQIKALSDRKIVDEISEKPEIMQDALRPFFMLLDENAQSRLMDNNPSEENTALRRFFINMTFDASKYAGVFYTNNQYAGLPAGERIDKRNTAMSMVASYLGMGKIIAGSRSFEMKIGDEIRQGTFQQKATGTDIKRITEDNEIVEIGKNFQYGDFSALDTSALKQQLSDLTVLDYICGNADRHSGNMLYFTGKDRSGKVVLTGIKGIDNDMSFGMRNAATNNYQEKMVNPEDMRIMRLTTAHRVLDLTPDKLDLILKDMDFTKGELDACHARLKTLQDRLKTDMKLQRSGKLKKITDGRILVVPDDQFKHYSVYKLGTPGKGKKGLNYFGRVMQLPRYLNKKFVQNDNFVKEEGKIQYVDATATRGSLNFANTDARTDIDLEQTANRLETVRTSFKELGSKWFTKDTGHFQWMQQSLEQLSDKFTELKARHQAKGDVTVEKADVIKLESLFRQIRMASTNYADTHKNPITSSGKARRDIAREMMGLGVVYTTSPVFDIKKAEVKEIKTTDIGRLMKDEKRANKKAADKKEKSAAKKNRPVRSRSVNLDNRKNMSM